MPCTVRTAWIPSANAPLATELVSRARRNARRARGNQIIRTKKRTGTTDKVNNPSSKSSHSIIKTMPNSRSKSPKAVIEFSKNSCNAYTSPCRRDIMRPTSVLSINDNETYCRCANMARRKSKMTCSPVRPTNQSWVKFAA